MLDRVQIEESFYRQARDQLNKKKRDKATLICRSGRKTLAEVSIATSSILTTKIIINHKTNAILTSKTNNLTSLQTAKRRSQLVESEKRKKMRTNNMITMNHIYCTSALMATFFTLSFGALTMADSALQASLQKLKVSPDVVNIPSYTTQIKLEIHDKQVKPGDPVPAKHLRDLNLAKITWEPNSWDSPHTLMLLDLDRKPGPNSTQNIYNQYTSLNIPGNSITAGQTIVAFEIPSVPCQPSTKHRLLALAFQQDQNIDISDVAYMSASSGQSKKRENFKLEDFISRHRLEIVAANIFLAHGEANGVCSGGVTLIPSQSLVFTLSMAMVIATTTALATKFSQWQRRFIM